MAPDSLEAAIGALLAQSGRNVNGFSIQPLAAGGNNRVFLVHCGAERLVAKWYWHDAADPRDRLGAEYAFLEHAWGMGLRCVPQAYARDPAAHLAIYEYVDGVKVASTTRGAEPVREAAAFFARLNGADSRSAAGALPIASEACFSVAEHFSMVDERIARLGGIKVETPDDQEAARLVVELAARWSQAKAGIQREMPDVFRTLGPGERCISPSDFGFHNALQRGDGRLCFIDFEYAGWDDPAKAIGDFFAHPGSPVARKHYDSFLTAALAPFREPVAMAERARLLDPVFRVKWCCIILNEFLPPAAKRRRFADASVDAAARKVVQLGKARTLFETLTS